MFNLTKKETHHPNSGFKKLHRRLRAHYKLSTNKDELSAESLAEADLLILGGPREPFSEEECSDIKIWLNGGGRMLFLASEGDKNNSSCNYSDLFGELGVSVNDDSVMRQVYYKYLHPKEVFIGEGILVPDMARRKVRVFICLWVCMFMLLLQLLTCGSALTNFPPFSSHLLSSLPVELGYSGRKKELYFIQDCGSQQRFQWREAGIRLPLWLVT